MEAAAPRSKRPGCPSSLWAITLVLLAVFSLIALAYGARARQARESNAANKLEATKLFAALEQYRISNRRYPGNLTALRERLPLQFSPGTRLLYTATADGQRYWVGIFPHRIASLILPSDDFLMEYDSRSRSWFVVYRDDAHAKGEDP